MFPILHRKILILPKKISAMSEVKAFADDKLTVGKMMISVSYLLENIVGKGENAGCKPAFSPFPTMFFKRLLP